MNNYGSAILVGKMPTTCVVVKCYNRHSRHSKRSFYHFPTDVNHHRKWVTFVSRRNADGSPWQPSDGDRICSVHFVLKENPMCLQIPTMCCWCIQRKMKTAMIQARVQVPWLDLKELSVDVR